MVSNFSLFCLETYLATFQKIGNFFPNHLVILVPSIELSLGANGGWIQTVEHGIISLSFYHH
jgi:hypothetical protein